MFFKVNKEKLLSVDQLTEPGLEHIEVEGLVSIDGRTMPLNIHDDVGNEYLENLGNFLNSIFVDIKALRGLQDNAELVTPKNHRALSEVSFASVESLVDFMRLFTRSAVFEKSDLNQPAHPRSFSGNSVGQGTGRIALKLITGILLGLTTIVLKREELLTKMLKVLNTNVKPVVREVWA